MRSIIILKMTMVFVMLPHLIKAQSPVNLLIGTYTNTGKSKGIYVYSFDPKSGNLTLKNQAIAENPSFLALSNNKKYLYAVNELNKGKGSISAFKYDQSTGELALLNTQLTAGDDPCHVSIDKNDHHVIVSNYSGGNFTVFGIEEDGRLTAKKQLIQHEGNGPNKSRQEKPHVHSAFFSPDGQQLFVQDLGTDLIHIYPYRENDEQQPISRSEVRRIPATPGSGPRHITFSKDGKFVYLIQEMTAAVTVFAYTDGMLEPIQELSMLAKDFKGEVGAADIHIAPDGKFLYASNRGEANDIAIYAIDTSTGKLSHLTNQPAEGRGPRNFALSPDGKFLLIANQSTDNVIVFERNPHTGLLKKTNTQIAVGAPVCLVFDY